MTTDMTELGQTLFIFFHTLILELTGKIGPVPFRNETCLLANTD